MTSPTRELRAVGRQQLRAHLLALKPEARRLRFANAMSHDSLRQYVGGIDFSRDAVLVVTDDDLAILGTAHLSRGDEHAELGMPVLPEARGRGVGARARCARRHNGLDRIKPVVPAARAEHSREEAMFLEHLPNGNDPPREVNVVIEVPIGRAKQAQQRGDPVRADDNPQVLRSRLEAYRTQTAPLIEFYARERLLRSVDGLLPIDAVSDQLAAALARSPEAA